jgi:hypothetical protein
VRRRVRSRVRRGMRSRVGRRVRSRVRRGMRSRVGRRVRRRVRRRRVRRRRWRHEGVSERAGTGDAQTRGHQATDEGPAVDSTS